MSGGRRRAVHLAAALAAACFYILGIREYSLLAQSPSPWQIVCRDGGGQSQEDYGRIRDIQEEEEGSFPCAFWKKEEGQAVENPQWGRTSQVTVWKIRGSMEVLFHGFVKLQEEDLQGCYLDAETAIELFGSTEVVGSQVLYGKRLLTVRGILEGEESLLALRPEGQEETDRITLGDGTWTEAGMKNFQVRYHIQGIVTHTGFLKRLLHLFLFLFPGLLAVRFFKDFHGLVARQGMGSLSRTAGKLAWWGLLLGFLCFISSQIEIPENMIPDRWSDFRFWSDWWASAKTSVVCFMQQDKAGGELRQMGYFMKGAFFSVLSLFFIR